ncbi:response regulator [Desulfobacterales bacterium HSG16]|nr:response regulator [Desulfobacterales bacterium HSG16]
MMAGINKKNWLKFTLAQKITIWILAISGIFTILTSSFQLYMDFRSGKEDIYKTLFIIESSHINSLKNSVWNIDKANINTQLDGIFNLPGIVHIQLTGKNFDDFFRGDIPDPNFQITREYLLHHVDYSSKKKIKIGVMTVTASLENVYTALKDKIVIIIISQAVKTFFVSFFILFLIYTLITRHLERIGKYLINIDINSMADPLTIDKGKHFLNFGDKDELDLLASEINSMQTDLRRSIKELNNEVGERKKAEDELTAINAHLEEMVDERTRTLVKTMEKARAADRAKSDFLARMSHEIRTPMNGIIGLTDLLLKSTLSFQQENYLNKVSTSSTHLLNIIDDILDFSKIEDGRLKTDSREFILNHVIGKVADIVSEKSAQKEIEMFYVIDKMIPLSLMGDPLRLKQILINLMGNAVKFTEKGHIILKVRLADALEPKSLSAIPVPNQTGEHARLLFSVQDTGIGISPENMNNLFRPFTQADGSVTRKYGGTGLGLSICRQLVNLMGGCIWIESVEGEGSTFCFTLTFELQPDEKKYVLTVPEDMHNLKILVMDDNEIARIILKEMLAGFDCFQITATDSGPKALAELTNALPDAPYDLVIIDWRMPQMDGFEVVRKIREASLFTKNMPKVIMVTMYGREKIFQRIKSKDIGIDSFVFKPVSSYDLFNSIMDAFEREDSLISCWKTDAGEIDCKAIDTIKGARILLAEDNSINQEVTVALLNKSGLINQVAENGREAVDILKSRLASNAPLYDAVLMDIEMPEMDGYEAVQLIREIPEFKNLPIIAMTAHALKGDREKCLNAGMNDYLSKPIYEQQLCAVLCKWIKPGKREISESMEVQQKGMLRMQKIPLEFYRVLPGINLESAITQLKCDENVLRRMLRSFLDQYEHVGSDIRNFLHEGHVHDAQMLVHSIKGVSGNLYAEELFLASQNLEAALRDEQTENIMPLLKIFEKNLDIVIKSLKSLKLKEKKIVPDPKVKKGETDSVRPGQNGIESNEIDQILKKMYILLEKKRTRGWNLLEFLQNLLPDEKFHEEKMTLEKSMIRLDTKKALSVLSELARKLKISLGGD